MSAEAVQREVVQTSRILFATGVPDAFGHVSFRNPERPDRFLMSRKRLGRALTAHLGDSKIVFMRGHGFTAVGQSVPQAAFRSVYTGVNCQIQLAAGQLGTPRFLSPEAASACDTSHSRSAFMALVKSRQPCAGAPP
jgi:ribulose-5-phosphate 4-epimerase/fuculose-1-phosphate aldolase